MIALEQAPFGFWLATILLLGLIAEAVAKLDRPWSRPLLLAYGTAGMWYHFDFIYNDPAEFRDEFPIETLDQAFFQVCWFLVCLRGFVGVFAGIVLKRVKAPPPIPYAVGALYEFRLFMALTLVWVMLIAGALIRTNGEVMSLICPPLSESGFPWGRPAVGGAWDFIASTANYIHLAVCGMAGVLVAVARRPWLRAASAILWLSSCPVFMFGRARNMILVIVIPGVLAYILIKRVSVMRKVGLAVAVFLAIASWFSFIQANRDSNFAILRGDAVVNYDESSARHYLGLDMFHELCYMNTFIDSGAYQVNWGQRYFADLVAVIPRPLWPSKPYIGVDYAIARGFGADTEYGAVASITPGMVGQGVLNFGKVLGPMAAAALLAGWVCLLARLWMQRGDANRMLLCLLGFGLTFNLGREITPLVLFPFVFAYIGVRVYELRYPSASSAVPRRENLGGSST